MEELTQVLSYQPTRPVVDGDPRKSKDRKVQLSYNVCYIVAAVIVEDNKVLMVQEAKQSCRGKWYLPAGRMEKGESIVEAVKREVKEEAGVEFEPESFIAMEYNASMFTWVRFVFTGRITGGSIKTPAQEDKESIQAQWLPANVQELVNAVPIRALDCLTLIQLGSKWYNEGEDTKVCQSISPTPHVGISLRVVLIHRSASDNMKYMLVRDSPAGNSLLPGNACGGYPDMKREVLGLIQSCGYKLECQVKGIINIEHDHTGGDGYCTTVLATASTDNNILEDGCGYHWEVILSPEEASRIDKMTAHKYGTAQLVDL